MNAKYGHYMEDYATYHRHPKNKITHYFGIPMIMFAVIALLQSVSLGTIGAYRLDVSLVVMAPILVFYLYLHWLSGVAMFAVFVVMYWSGSLVPALGLWVLFVAGWILQFLGHHFEGKKPAFFRNALHLLVGPLWILNDLLLKLKLPAYRPGSA